jgi:hypothetical protein
MHTKIIVFKVVTPCNVSEEHGDSIFRRKRRTKEEECDHQTGGVISQKTIIFVVIAVRPSQIQYMENV